MLLTKLHTGNHEFIALTHGLNGRTALTMSVTGIGMWRADSAPVITEDDINFILTKLDEVLSEI